jgi:hypothetical protein
VTASRERLLRLGVWASAGVAALGAVGTLFASGPYISVSKGIEAWVIVWAVGIFGLLMCAPFLLHDRIDPDKRDRDRRWEVAIVGWGALALAGVVLCALILWFGSGPSSPLGALALMALLEFGLVLGAVLTLVLAT